MLSMPNNGSLLIRFVQFQIVAATDVVNRHISWNLILPYRLFNDYFSEFSLVIKLCFIFIFWVREYSIFLESLIKINFDWVAI